MRWIGFLLIAITLNYIRVQYVARAKESVLECEEIFSFISLLQIEIGCYLKPISKIAEAYSSPILERCGFLPSLRAGEGAYTAFLSSCGTLSFSEEESALIAAAFYTLSEGDIHDGTEALAHAAGRLEEILSELKGRCKRDIKLASTLSVTLTLGVLLLLI